MKTVDYTLSWSFKLQKLLYNHKCPSVCLVYSFISYQNPSTAWNHPPSPFIPHHSSFIILHASFLHSATFKLFSLLVFFVRKTLKNPTAIFTAKYRISTAVMIVNPVRSPIVPPIAEIILTNVVALSLVTLVKTGTFSNVKLTNLSPSLLLSSKKILCIIYLQ